jgi:hypothetical protein
MFSTASVVSTRVTTSHLHLRKALAPVGVTVKFPATLEMSVEAIRDDSQLRTLLACILVFDLWLSLSRDYPPVLQLQMPFSKLCGGVLGLCK